MHCSLSKYRAVCDNRRELAVNNGALRKSIMLTTAVRVTPRTANVRAGVATLHKRPLIVDVAGIAHASSAAIEYAMRRETGVAAFFRARRRQASSLARRLLCVAHEQRAAIARCVR